MNFKEYVILKETPDKSVGGLGWHEDDAFSFLIDGDFILKGTAEQQIHHELLLDFKDMLESGHANKSDYDELFIYHGIPSARFKRDVLRRASRKRIIENFPEILLGRIWEQNNVISFWNRRTSFNEETIKSTIDMIVNMGVTVPGDPAKYIFEIENQQYSYEQFLNITSLNPINKKEDAVFSSETEMPIHTLPPEKKGNVMKNMGIKPKIPLGVQKRFAMGENKSFKDFYSIVNERAYHGTPHKIEGDFSYEKVGTGEGAQAFGWGFYFAENKDVASSYKPKGYKRSYIFKGVSGIDWLQRFERLGEYSKESVWEKILLHYSKQQIMSLLADDTDAIKYIKSIPNNVFAKQGGQLYEVELNVYEEYLLEWRKTFREQSKQVQNILSKIQNEIINGYSYIFDTEPDFNTVLGGEIYNSIKEAFSIPKDHGGLQRTEYDQFPNKFRNASMLLNQLGIQGIVYLDNYSNAEQQGTRNIVVFDPKRIHIENAV